MKSTKPNFTGFLSERILPVGVLWLSKNVNQTVGSLTLLLSAHSGNFRKKFGLLSVCWKWFFGKTMHSAPPKRCTVDDWNQFCKFLQDCWENPSEHSEVSLVYLSLVFKVFPTCWSQDSGFWPKFYVAQNKGWLWASRVEARTTWNPNPFVFKN